MVTLIEITSNIEEKIKAFESEKGLQFILDDSIEKALSTAGNFFREKTSEWIESSGEGTWPPKGAIAKAFDSKFQTGNLFTPAKDKTPYEFLAKFPRYNVNEKRQRAKIFYGKTGKGQKGKPDSFLQKIGAKIEKPQTIRVTQAMRRFIAAASTVNDIPLFAIRGDTDQFNIPARPVGEPVFQRHQREAFKEFEESFEDGFKAKFENL